MIVFLLTLVGLGTQLTLLNVQRPMGDTDISLCVRDGAGRPTSSRC